MARVAKLHLAPIDEAALERYLNEDDDFAFELSCLRLLKETKAAHIEHGGTYADPVTGINRQFDFRVKLVSSKRCVSLAIECKNLKRNFPLLVSRVPRMPEEAFHEVLIPVTGRPAYLLETSRTERRKGMRSIYSETVSVGKSTVQVGLHDKGFTANDSEVHEKWAQAIASSYDLLAERFPENPRDPRYHEERFVIPILLVPDGTLWSCDYNAAGVRGSVIQTNYVEFLLNHSPWKTGQSFDYCISHLHFVTETGMRDFMKKFSSDSEISRLVFFGSARQ